MQIGGLLFSSLLSFRDLSLMRQNKKPNWFDSIRKPPAWLSVVKQEGQ